jgi:hypothetical protein
MNLSLRIFSRRFTRKTLGYSKKLENLRHAVAIFTAHFNFIRKHSAHGMTPAQPGTSCRANFQRRSATKTGRSRRSQCQKRD